MAEFKFVHNIVEANGKTVRENNLALQHKIPLGTLVEVDLDYSDNHGIRAFVVKHGRDCDGEPLYSLGMSNDLEKYNTETNDPLINHLRGFMIEGAFPDSCLKIIKEAKT